jgi:regulatory protein
VERRVDAVNLMRSRSRQPNPRRFSARDEPREPAIFAPDARITEISESNRRPGRFDVLVDGRRAAMLSVDGIVRLALHVGDEWTEPLAQRAADEAEALRVFDRGLAMLAVRAYAVRELRMGLLRKKEPEPLVDAAVARHVTLGALNDEVFARQFVRTRVSREGIRRIQSELGRRGVSRELAAAAIAEVREEERVDPDEALDRIAARKLKTMSKLDGPTKRRRLYGFLARRGYEPDEIRRVIKEIGE